MRALARFLMAETDSHPFGESGRRWVLDPHANSKSCWDSSPNAIKFSEYGNSALMVD